MLDRHTNNIAYSGIQQQVIAEGGNDVLNISCMSKSQRKLQHGQKTPNTTQKNVDLHRTHHQSVLMFAINALLVFLH